MRVSWILILLLFLACNNTSEQGSTSKAEAKNGNTSNSTKQHFYSPVGRYPFLAVISAIIAKCTTFAAFS